MTNTKAMQIEHVRQKSDIHELKKTCLLFSANESQICNLNGMDEGLSTNDAYFSKFSLPGVYFFHS